MFAHVLVLAHGFGFVLEEVTAVDGKDSCDVSTDSKDRHG